MSDIARRAAEEVTRMAIANVSPGAKPTTAEERTAVVQSAIEEAREQWEIKYRATLRDSWRVQKQSDDTKRLDWLENERPIMTSGGLEIEATESLREAIDAAMNEGK